METCYNTLVYRPGVRLEETALGICSWETMWDTQPSGVGPAELVGERVGHSYCIIAKGSWTANILDPTS